MQVVTVSASYGAGGSIIAPAVAERLGVPFVDRAIPTTVAAEIGVPIEEVLAHDDRAEYGLGRLLASAARLPNVALGGIEPSVAGLPFVAEEEFVSHTESVIRNLAGQGGGVFLGRAAAAVLANYPGSLHVRIDGPAERRVTQAMHLLGVDERSAARQQRETDQARAAYVRHFYGHEPDDPTLYHLMLDGTTVPHPTCVDLIVAAARALGIPY